MLAVANRVWSQLRWAGGWGGAQRGPHGTRGVRLAPQRSRCTFRWPARRAGRHGSAGSRWSSAGAAANAGPSAAPRGCPAGLQKKQGQQGHACEQHWGHWVVQSGEERADEGGQGRTVGHILPQFSFVCLGRWPGTKSGTEPGTRNSARGRASRSMVWGRLDSRLRRPAGSLI